MEQTFNVILPDDIDRSELFGNMDANLRIINETLKADIIQRGNELIIKGNDSDKAQKILIELVSMLSKGEKLDSQKVGYVISLAERGVSYSKSDVDKDIICYTHLGKPLKPKTIGQKAYVKAIRDKDIVFGIGPAGTGKTYIAVAMAVAAYKRREVERIILTRPAVEAGERLGFLPGDLQEKVNPYLRPLFDGLSDMFGIDEFIKLQQKGMIEVAPLAYMRGRTLEKSFIILDEAQNTTKEQIKMFLTRLGNRSKMVINGDITQIDLPSHTVSGLVDAQRVLKNVKGISTIKFTSEDVVRHDLVAAIINAYEKDAKRKRKAEDRKNYGNNDQLQ